MINYDKTLFELKEKLRIDLINYPNHAKGYESNIWNAFKIVTGSLIQIDNVDKIKLSLTDSPSLFYTVYFGDFKLRYEVFVNNEIPYICFSLYENDELDFRDSGNHEECYVNIIARIRTGQYLFTEE